MNLDFEIERVLVRYPALAVASYIIIVCSFVSVIWISVVDTYDQARAVSTAADNLRRIESRIKATGETGQVAEREMRGSPFLEGSTITVAGATLLERVAAAVTQVGGSVLSSQVDVKGEQSADGFVNVIVVFEVSEPNLQRLLYDIESGLPFLFVDRLDVQSSGGVIRSDGGRIHVSIGVTGQWRGSS